MPDVRFFEPLGPLSLADLAAFAGAQAPAEKGHAAIVGVAPLARAGATQVSFFSDRRHLAELAATAAFGCFVPASNAALIPKGCVPLLTPEPQAAYARAAARLHRIRTHPPGSPAVHPLAELEDEVELGPGVVVGPGARIGARTRIGAHAVIGPGVQIGRDGRIGPNTVIGFALIGDRVRVLAGAVVGEEGFGVAASTSGALDLPQLGRVILQDGVTLGANACVDRGAYDDTVIGENTKVDNLVQVAHNVVVGRNCVLAAHTGISGSVTVGDGAMFGGRAGVVDHVNIGAGAKITAAAAVMKSVGPGEVWGGSPARPARRWMREAAWLARQAEKGSRG